LNYLNNIYPEWIQRIEICLINFALEGHSLCSYKVYCIGFAPEGQPVKPYTMSDTYTQLYIQLVFAVKGRYSFIHPSWEENLHKYITGVIQNDKHKMLAINSMPDHIHIFLGLNPVIAISDLVKDIKRASNNWINQNRFTNEKFEWQAGYGAFSYGKSQIDQVCNYIFNQKNHHSKYSFEKEYISLLKLFNIDFKEEYLFEFYQ
jgi:REP-associated tyrosine transposase